MPDPRDTLIDCFQTVFPSLARDAIPGATKETVEAWDSMQQQTLMAVVEETFGMRIAPKDLEAFTSFAGILALVEARKS